MSLQAEIKRVKEQNPLWKSNSRIIGRAAEIYSCEKIKCINCNEINWLECSINEKSKDQICKNCGKKYQIKSKKITQNSYHTVKKKCELKTIGAEYNATLKSIESQIDYIIILYEKITYNILDIIHVQSKDITKDNVIPRKPLTKNARRAGWKGCHLYFTNIGFLELIL